VTAAIQDLDHPGLDWELSLAEIQQRSERRAWRIAACALAIAGLSSASLVLVIPIKQVIPYLITVDRVSGQNELVSLAANQPASLRIIEAKYWVGQYVRTRERIDRSWMETDFSSVIRWSGRAEARNYAAAIAAMLASERQGKHTPETRVDILSIGLIDDTHAVVRFLRSALPVNDSAPAPASRGTATLVFAIQPMLVGKERDLIDNPLGFRVESYRVDNDLIDVGAAP
jgi:type IV secretion system protein VirB8